MSVAKQPDLRRGSDIKIKKGVKNMNSVYSLYVNGQVYDIVLRNNVVYRSFIYDAASRAFVKGEDKVDQRDVSMYREA